MVPWKSFTFVRSKIQRKKKKKKIEIQDTFYLHQIEDVEFIFDKTNFSFHPLLYRIVTVYQDKGLFDFVELKNLPNGSREATRLSFDLINASERNKKMKKKKKKNSCFLTPRQLIYDRDSA